jgi:hypothetical protein
MTTVRAETEVKPHAVCADTWLTYRASFQAGELAVQSLVYDVEQNEGRDFGVPKAWSVEAIQKYGDRSYVVFEQCDNEPFVQAEIDAVYQKLVEVQRAFESIRTK